MKFFLIGFMGSGKTYWGKKWSRKYQFEFFDLDEVIEEEQGKAITSIFENEGEGYFRQIETVVLKTFSEKDNCIIACGGGAACFNDNLKWMNENGITVYLSASPEYIHMRVLSQQHKRPLIKDLNQDELLFFIEQKLKGREYFYKQAKIILPVEGIDDNFVPDFLIHN